MTVRPYFSEKGFRTPPKWGDGTPLSLDFSGLIERAIGPGYSEALKKALVSAFEDYAPLVQKFGDFAASGSLTPGDQFRKDGLGAMPLLPESTAKAVAEAPCVLAVMDETLPYGHSVLRRPFGETRLAEIWLQDCHPWPDQHSDLPFGRAVSGAQVAQIEASGVTRLDPRAVYYKTGPLDPLYPGQQQRYAQNHSHGSAVLGLAAEPFDGTAPQGSAPVIMGVNVPPNAVRDTSGALLPFFLIMGMLYVLERSRKLAAQLAPYREDGQAPEIPVVFSLSFGILAGPKDGSHPLEQVMDALAASDLSGLGPVKFVLPMGNARRAAATATVPSGKSLGLRLLPDDWTPSYLEIWAPRRTDKPKAQSRISVTLTSPSGEELSFAGGAVGTITSQSLAAVGAGATVLAHWIANETAEGWREAVVIEFPATASQDLSAPVAPAGRWRLTLTDAEGAELQAHVQRDDPLDGLSSGGRQGRFEVPEDGVILDATGTVSAFATGAGVTRAGGVYLDAVPEEGETHVLAPYSGALWDGADNPDGDAFAPTERSATSPGVPVHSLVGGRSLPGSGTSMAAPQIARQMAQALIDGMSSSG